MYRAGRWLRRAWRVRNTQLHCSRHSGLWLVRSLRASRDELLYRWSTQYFVRELVGSVQKCIGARSAHARICARLVARLQTDQPSPARKTWGFAVCASRNGPGAGPGCRPTHRAPAGPEPGAGGTVPSHGRGGSQPAADTRVPGCSAAHPRR